MTPMHPGEIPGRELDEVGLSSNALSEALGVPVDAVTTVAKGQRRKGGHRTASGAMP